MNLEKLAAAWWPLVRDVLCVIVALRGLILEASYGGPVRGELVLAYVGVLGTPVFLRKDQKDRGDSGESHPEPREADR